MVTHGHGLNKTENADIHVGPAGVSTFVEKWGDTQHTVTSHFGDININD